MEVGRRWRSDANDGGGGGRSVVGKDRDDDDDDARRRRMRGDDGRSTARRPPDIVIAGGREADVENNRARDESDFISLEGGNLLTSKRQPQRSDGERQGTDIAKMRKSATKKTRLIN